VPTTDQSLLRATTSPGSLASAEETVRTVRTAWQACQTAHANLNAYNTQLNRYKSRLAAYDKKYHVHGAEVVRSSKGRVEHRPPPGKPTGGPPQIPPNCPTPAASSGGTP
jgi:hypothetical protein